MGTQLYSMGRSASISLYEVMSVSLNPASINNTANSIASIHYLHMDTDIQIYSVGIILTTPEIGNFGLSYYRFAIDIAETDSDLPSIIGPMTLIQNYFLMSYGYSISSAVNFGLNGKFMRTGSNSNQDQYFKQSIALDIGLNYQPAFAGYLLENLRFGIAAQNIVSTPFDGSRLERDIRFVLEDRINFDDIELTGLFNFRYYENFSMEWTTGINLGFDITYSYFSGRIGYTKNFFSLGAGLRYKSFSLNYGYGNLDNAGFNSRNSLSLNYSF